MAIERGKTPTTGWRWRWGPVALVMLVGVVGACSGDDDDADASGSETTSESTSEATAESTTSSLPVAADGTDLAACSDGDCEVEVALDALPVDIALDGTLGIDNLTVNAITDVIDVDSVGSGAQQHVEVPVGTPGGVNNVVVTLVAVGDDAAVVRLSPADNPITLPTVSTPSVDLP